MSESAVSRPAVAVFGGTFDPVHYGHLRSALELVEKLELAELRLLPCAVPPHRATPACDAAHRAAMVEQAVAGEPRLACDPRELRRSGKSYTFDSLAELRGELGDDASLCLVVGCDAVLEIDTWHRWEELLDKAHVVVLARPGWSLPDSGAVARWVAQNQVRDGAELHRRPAGAVLLEELRPLDISSTEIRRLLASGRSPRYLLPDSVLDYIHRHQLYR